MESAVTEYLNVGNVLLFLFAVLLINQLNELYQFRNMPPGPRFPSLPLIGNLLSFDLSTEGFVNNAVRLKAKYGRMLSLKLGSFKLVIAATPEAVREVLVTRSGDYSGRQKTYFLSALTLGFKDIAFSDGFSWSHHRRIFVSAVRQHLSNTALIEGHVTRSTQKLVKLFEAHAGGSFDPCHDLMTCLSDVISVITFGEGRDTSDPDIENLLSLKHAGMLHHKELQFMLFLDFFPITKYFPSKSFEAVVSCYQGALEVIRKKLREIEQTFDLQEQPKYLIQYLLHAREEAIAENSEQKIAVMSEDYLINTIENMFAAGYETTATTLSWAIGFLVQNPKYQRDIQRQLDDVVGDDRMPLLEDRASLPLVHAVVMETLRLGNVAPQAILRRVVKDTFLCGYRVPKDTLVSVDLEAVHLDPECWENPTVFDPYRFIDEEGNLVTNQGNFYPFSAGRRGCAGEAMAKLQLFLFLSWMLHKFTFVPEGPDPPELKPLQGFVQCPAPYQIKAIKRK